MHISLKASPNFGCSGLFDIFSISNDSTKDVIVDKAKMRNTLLPNFMFDFLRNFFCQKIANGKLSKIHSKLSINRFCVDIIQYFLCHLYRNWNEVVFPDFENYFQSQKSHNVNSQKLILFFEEINFHV